MMESTTILPDQPIYHATIACQGSFEKCQGLQGLNANKWAENRLADFNLWASGIGASSFGRVSLDSRLSLRPDIQETVTNLLRILQNLVINCIESAYKDSGEDVHHLSSEYESRDTFDIGSRSPSPYSDVSSDIDEPVAGLSSQQLHVVRAMSRVDNIFEQLGQIALAIRRTGRRSRLQRADRAEHREGLNELEELRRHLIMMVSLRKWPQSKDTYSSQLPNLNDLGDIQRRLIDCNIKRRHRFLYAQARIGRKALSEQPMQLGNVKKVRSDQIAASTVSKPSKKMPPIANNSQIIESQPLKQGASIKTDTTITTMSSKYEHPVIKKPSDTATQMSVTVSKIQYPRVSISEDKQIFKCPCCCQPLPAMFAEHHRWKKHVAEDLYPYTCILPNCDEPEQLYATKEAWREHLSQGHESMVYWECFICPNMARFEQEDIFIDHIHQLHSAVVSSDQIPALLPALRHSIPSATESCPLCPTRLEGQFSKETLLDHIAEHVHKFSLYSLPWGPETVENGSNKKTGRNSSVETEDRTNTWVALSLATLQQQQDDQDNLVDIEDNLSRHKSWMTQMNTSIDQTLVDPQKLAAKSHYFENEDNIYFDCDKSTTSSGSEPRRQGPKETLFLWNVPYDRNLDFKDYNAELASLLDRIFLSQLLVIRGPRDAGKTELVRELCFQVRERDMKEDIDRSIFWLDATSSESMYESYLEIVRQIEGIKNYDAVKEISTMPTPEIFMKNDLNSKSFVPWLLIVDGDGDHNMRWIDLANNLPIQDRCCTIITTRDQDFGSGLPEGDVLVLDALVLGRGDPQFEWKWHIHFDRSKEKEKKYALVEDSIPTVPGPSIVPSISNKGGEKGNAVVENRPPAKQDKTQSGKDNENLRSKRSWRIPFTSSKAKEKRSVPSEGRPSPVPSPNIIPSTSKKGKEKQYVVIESSRSAGQNNVQVKVQSGKEDDNLQLGPRWLIPFTSNKGKEKERRYIRVEERPPREWREPREPRVITVPRAPPSLPPTPIYRREPNVVPYVPRIPVREHQETRLLAREQSSERHADRQREDRRLAERRATLDAYIEDLRARQAQHEVEREEARQTRAREARLREIDSEIARIKAELESIRRRRRAAEDNVIHRIGPGTDNGLRRRHSTGDNDSLQIDRSSRRSKLFRWLL